VVGKDQLLVCLAVFLPTAGAFVLPTLMFRLQAPLAGVFELSVCAGLIPAIFLSTIGLTQRLAPETLAARRKEKVRRSWFLPILLAAPAVVVSREDR
jgi:NADH:ubiquinone oxidoreductase subunit 6 (subunit J)